MSSAENNNALVHTAVAVRPHREHGGPHTKEQPNHTPYISTDKLSVQQPITTIHNKTLQPVGVHTPAGCS